MRARFLGQGHQRTGFSLIELMVVLAIVVALLGTGVPLLRNSMQSQRITTTVNEFFASMNLARSEAIQRGMRVDLVPFDRNGDWAKGWVVFVDGNNNQRPDAGERVIFAQSAIPKGISITANLTDSTVPYLAYNGTGRTRTNASSERTQFGSFTFRLDSHVRKIKLNFLGRARVCNPAFDKDDC
ncbi:MAG TPA: GspH/FimT family pseudopilin [Noviherbaspirillum sp.]|nr:GspH/FimT family pseudopilin [Noviherbaspirillum sp.]